MSEASTHYDRLFDRLPTNEMTYLVVSGLTRSEAAELLDSDTQPSAIDTSEPDGAPWSILDVVGGVLAVEPTGYHDPSTETLRQLSQGGRVSAVVRDNVQGRLRFGCARNGQVLFDDDDLLYAENPAAVPEELRYLLDSVWVGRDEDLADREESPFAVCMHMAGVITGLAISTDDVDRVVGAERVSDQDAGLQARTGPSEPLREMSWDLKTRKGRWQLVTPSLPAPDSPHQAVSITTDGVFLDQPGRAEWDVFVSLEPVFLGDKWNAVATWECGRGEVRLVHQDGGNAARLPTPLVAADRMRVTIAARHETREEHEQIANGLHTTHDLMIYIQVMSQSGAVH